MRFVHIKIWLILIFQLNFGAFVKFLDQIILENFYTKILSQILAVISKMVVMFKI